MDADARVDLLFCRWSGSPRWGYLRNEGGGVFTTQAISSASPGNCGAMHAADLDDDGDVDLVTGGWAGGLPLLSWQENQGDGWGAGLGGALSRKLHLHAAQLGFRHPVTGKDMRFFAPLPEHMARTWELLGWDPAELKGELLEQP